MLTGRQILEAIEILRDCKDRYTQHEYWEVYYLLRAEFYASREWRELSEQVRKETPYCERCFTDIKQLHAHHIKYLYSYTYLGLEAANLEVLCEDCHKDEHKQKAA